MIQKLSDNGYDKRWFLDFDNSNDFYLYEIGTYKCPPCYGYGPAIRTRDIFHFVISGKGTLYIDDNIYSIKAGQGFLIPANVKAYYEADNDDPWHYMWIHLGGARLSEALYSAGINEHQPVFSSTSPTDKIQTIFNEIFDNKDDEYYCIGKIYEFMSFLTNTSKSRVAIETSPQLNYVKKTIKYIQLKYSEAIHIDDISNSCGLNRSYLSRLFKDATGSSIQEYLMTYRMKTAVKLMKETDKTIQDISLAVGYNDIFTFSKAFKKHYGTPPKEYRKHLTN